MEPSTDKLADDVKAIILAKAGLIKQAKGKVVIEMYPNHKGYEVNLTVTV